MLLNRTRKIYNSLDISIPDLSKKIIINLIGSNNNVSKSAYEIKYFSEVQSLHTVIIDDNINIFTEIYNYNPNIIINKCRMLKCKEIQAMNYVNKASSLNTYKNYTFLVETAICEIDKEEKRQLRKCEHIDDIYNLDLSISDKKNMIYMYL
jgi:hypothetical protein